MIEKEQRAALDDRRVRLAPQRRPHERGGPTARSRFSTSDSQKRELRAVGGGISPSRGVYIQPVPATGPRYQIPKQQGLDFHPVWGPKGDALFYVPSAASGMLAAVSVTTQPGIVFGSPAILPARVTAGRLSNESRAHDILPDGRFVGLVGATDSDGSEAPPSGQLRIVLNWFEELKQRVPR